MAGIVGALKPNVNMLSKTWIYLQRRFYVPYWLIMIFVVLAAVGVFLMLDKNKGKDIQ